MPNEEVTQNREIQKYTVGNENPIGNIAGKEGDIYIENITVDDTKGIPSLYINTSKESSSSAWVKVADENCVDTIPHAKVINNLSELLTNSVNMVDKFYDIFINPEPHLVEIEMYNKQGILSTVKIPNRAMDRNVALSGEGSPEDKVEAFAGALYIDIFNNQLYVKQTEKGSMGWQNITPQPIKEYEEKFEIGSSTNRLTLSHMTDDNNPPAVYVNGILMYPENYNMEYDKRTINFNETLPANSNILVKYFVGLYGLKGETALTVKTGETITLPPRKQGYVKNVGTDKDIILEFGMPVGPLEWGNITGTLTNQKDLKDALDKKQDNLKAGSHIEIKNNTVTAIDKWGGITGTLNDQADLKTALDKKQDNLTAGNHIKIENNTVTAIDTWGGISGTLSNQKDLKDALDKKQDNLTAGNHVKIENNTVTAIDEWGGITGTLSNQTDLKNALDAKQGNLIAGSHIKIEGNTISATNTWGDITGTLANQTDLKNALDGKQNNLTAGNHIKIEGNTITAVDTWGGITGTLANQTDLKNALDAKQGNLTAGNNITIKDGTISATSTWGSINGTLANQTDLKNALDGKQSKLTAGDNIKIENNVIGSVSTWGSITGSILDQKDLKDALDAKQTGLTAGNHITITNGAINAIDTWGGISGTLANQTDLKNALDGKQSKLTAGDNIKIENNTISVTGDLGSQVVFRTWK